MSGACVLDAWSFEVPVPSELVVLPDGCRDIIVRLDPHSVPTLIVSPLDAHPRWLRVAQGVAFSGLRLRPGAIVDEDALRVLWTRSPQRSAEALITQLERVVFVEPNVEEVLEALSAPAFNPAQAAKSLGVSLRALQREMKKANLPPPQFWAQLVRARRAARAVREDIPLAQIAIEYGFSDQSHMSREFRRWFAVTPKRLRQGADEVFRMLRASGYD